MDGIYISYWKSCELPPLDMTKDDLLALLGSVNSMEAGAAISFVRSLPRNDVRFAISFEGGECCHRVLAGGEGQAG